MPVTVSKKPIAAKVEAPAVQQTPTPANTNAAGPTAVPKAAAPSWMMKGAQAKAEYDSHDAKQEAAQEAAKRMFRFRLAMGAQGSITFVDGNLDGDGMLDALCYYEHTVNLGGKWQNFVCVGGGHGEHGSEPCPICEGGDKPALVSVMTVIDHTPYTIQKGPKKGQVVVDQRKLFVAKPKTMASLRLKASNLKGLAGWRFNVARLGDAKAPGVGTDFDKDESVPRMTPQQLIAAYGAEAAPADYTKEIIYLPAAKLIALGCGKPIAGPGYNNGNFNAQAMAEQL